MKYLIGVDILNEPVKIEWKEAACLPVCRTAHTAVFLRGSVYVGGGFKGSNDDKKDCYRLDAYNLITNQWIPSPINTPTSWFAMTVLNDKLIIAGGETNAGNVCKEVFSLDEGDWKYYSEMPTARVKAAAIGYQSMLIVVGGDNTISYLAATELLDTANGCWYTCEDLPMAQSQIKLTVVANSLYVLGGANVSPSPQAFTASLDNFSSHQLKWQSLPDTPWCYSAPVSVYNKFLLTVGGRSTIPKIGNKTNEVCAFNPTTGSWQPIANLPSARSFPAVVGVADNKIIVLGGITQQNEFSNNVWVGRLE